ncbi:ATP-binding cassette domain-containing protein [Photobacterium damselae]|uniref:ABC transporter ATP-binding protein n=1 Tax=Photobacterium damselae TaxID=38293 RepID=UPI001EDE4B75|nr:ATP-binding cassette domain-containing protein [Photobacterium damselae]MCG3812819.1 ATP-binding cassette domain-containing protein [Photobacterium damselae]
MLPASHHSLRFQSLRSGFEDPSLAFTDEVCSGQHLAIWGDSGCGKTSLIQVIASLKPAQQGEFYYQDRAITPLSFPWWRQQIGYLPQQPIMGGDTVEQVLLLPWQMQAMDKSIPLVTPSQCEQALNRANLSVALSKEVNLLSGGEKQRLALARLLLMQRPVWLLDEPTSALDMSSRDHLIALVKESSAICISVSHDPIWYNAADMQYAMTVSPPHKELL